jgi:hypothetical protein
VGARGAVGAVERRFEDGRVVEDADWRWEGSGVDIPGCCLSFC